MSGFHEIELDPDDYSWRYRGALHDLAGGLKAKLLTYLMEHPGTPFEPVELAERVGGTKDAIRMQLERLKRRIMVTAEQRVKQVDIGANRSRPQTYKVYLSCQNPPPPTRPSGTDFCSAMEIPDPEPVPFQYMKGLFSIGTQAATLLNRSMGETLPPPQNPHSGI